MKLIASTELRSEHPLGKAIVSHFKTSSKTALEEPEKFEMVAGRGVKAIAYNNTIFAGNADLLAENSVLILQNMRDKASTYENKGCTIIYVALNSKEAGIIALSDTLREDSVKMIKKLKAINIER